MARRPLISNPLKLKPRDLPQRDGREAEGACSWQDFEPRLRHFTEEARRLWPGGAPASWREAVQAKRVPTAYPGMHWAVLECLFELGREGAESAPSRPEQHAWHTLSLALAHLIVDGGGLPSTLVVQHRVHLNELLQRAGACLPSFAVSFPQTVGHRADLTPHLERLSNFPSVQADPLKRGFVSVLDELSRFQDRLLAPVPAATQAALRFLLVERRTLFERALQIHGSSRAARPQPGTETRLADSSSSVLLGLQQVAARVLDAAAEGQRKESPLKALLATSRVLLSGESPVRQSPGRPTPKLAPRPSSSRRRRRSDARAEESWARSATPGILRPGKGLGSALLLTTTGLFTLLALFVGQWTISAGDQGAPTESSETGLPNPHDVIDEFVQAGSVEDRLRLLGGPIDEADVRSHFAEIGPEESAVELVKPLGYARSGTLSFFAAQVRFKSGRSRLLCVLTDPETGELSIDWHAYARTPSVAWSRLLSGEMPSSSVRVFVGLGDYYNFAFEDSSRFQSYRITSPDLETVLYGYVEVGSERHALLNELLEGKRLQRMIIRLRKPEAASREPTQFMIEEVIANDWVEDPTGSLEGSAFGKDVGGSRGNV